MIVVPTEKQFDWRYAPVILFLIVLFNVLIFFLYQSGDSEKYTNALSNYEDSGFIEQEWPLFKQYLHDNGDTETLEELTTDYEDEYFDSILTNMLMDRGFFDYLTLKAPTTFEPSFYDRWQPERTQIQQDFNAISSIAHGLNAKELKLSALLTHQFLHGGVMHLLGNMFFLVICGFAVEAAIGHWRFLGFYLLGGFAAGMAQVASDWNSSVPLVGASGAISAVMAMYLAVFRLRNIEFFYWVFCFVGYFRAPALIILPLYVGKELYSYHIAEGSNVAFLAHAGGFIAGAVLIGISFLFDRKTINKDYVEAEKIVDPNQESMANIYRAIESFSFNQAFKLVNDAIKSQGETFELALIRFNLLNLAKGKGYPQSVLRLWQLNRLLPHEVERLERIWLSNPNLHPHLDDHSALRLGLQFVTLQDPLAAEQVFAVLRKRGCKDPSLSIFALKLAHVFGQTGHSQKQAQYQKAANQLSQGGLHGAV